MFKIAIIFSMLITQVLACTPIDCSSGCTVISVAAGQTYPFNIQNCVAPAYMMGALQATSSDTFQVVVTSYSSSDVTTSATSSSCYSSTFGSSSYTNEDVSIKCNNYYFACSITTQISSQCLSSVWITSDWSACSQCVQTRTAKCVFAVNGVATTTPSTGCGVSPNLQQSCACSLQSTGPSRVSTASTGVASAYNAPVGSSGPPKSGSSSISLPVIIGIAVAAGVVVIAIIIGIYWYTCRPKSVAVADVV